MAEGRDRGSEVKARAQDLGLLLLRAGSSLSLLLLFAPLKIHDAIAFLHTGAWRFVDFNRKVGLPLPVAVAFLQTVNESLVALLLALGVFGRAPAALLGVSFVAATLASARAHEDVFAPGAYALVFLSLALTGPGGVSLDAALASWRRRGSR
jgi:uncharacterized membrane protein YphA (DoxX/SURF4 family)